MFLTLYFLSIMDYSDSIREVVVEVMNNSSLVTTIMTVHFL